MPGLGWAGHVSRETPAHVAAGPWNRRAQPRIGWTRPAVSRILVFLATISAAQGLNAHSSSLTTSPPHAEANTCGATPTLAREVLGLLTGR